MTLDQSSPVRLCCGERHWSVQCLDEKVMCCLCFSRFPVEGLHIDEKDGRYEDVCIECAALELKEDR